MGGHGRVDRAVEIHLDLAAHQRGHLVGQVEHAPTQLIGVERTLEIEDAGADLADGLVDIGHGPVDPADQLVVLGDPGRTLEGQAHGEKALDDRVVEVPGDAVPVLDQRELADPFVQPGPLDGHAGRHGQGRDHGLVLNGEGPAVPLVGQVEVAVGLTPDLDGDAQEAGHRGVVGRKAGAVGVIGQDVYPEGLGFADEPAQNAPAGRRVADGHLLVVGQADGDELLERRPRGVEDPQGSVTGVDQLAGGANQVVEAGGNVGGVLGRQHRLDQTPELLRVVDPVVRHWSHGSHHGCRRSVHALGRSPDRTGGHRPSGPARRPKTAADPWDVGRSQE